MKASSLLLPVVLAIPIATVAIPWLAIVRTAERGSPSEEPPPGGRISRPPAEAWAAGRDPAFTRTQLPLSPPLPALPGQMQAPGPGFPAVSLAEAEALAAQEAALAAQEAEWAAEEAALGAQEAELDALEAAQAAEEAALASEAAANQGLFLSHQPYGYDDSWYLPGEPPPLLCPELPVYYEEEYVYDNVVGPYYPPLGPSILIVNHYRKGHAHRGPGKLAGRGGHPHPHPGPGKHPKGDNPDEPRGGARPARTREHAGTSPEPPATPAINPRRESLHAQRRAQALANRQAQAGSVLSPDVIEYSGSPVARPSRAPIGVGETSAVRDREDAFAAELQRRRDLAAQRRQVQARGRGPELAIPRETRSRSAVSEARGGGHAERRLQRSEQLRQQEAERAQQIQIQRAEAAERERRLAMAEEQRRLQAEAIERRREEAAERQRQLAEQQRQRQQEQERRAREVERQRQVAETRERQRLASRERAAAQAERQRQAAETRARREQAAERQRAASARSSQARSQEPARSRPQPSRRETPSRSSTARGPYRGGR